MVYLLKEGQGQADDSLAGDQGALGMEIQEDTQPGTQRVGPARKPCGPLEGWKGSGLGREHRGGTEAFSSLALAFVRGVRVQGRGIGSGSLQVHRVVTSRQGLLSWEGGPWQGQEVARHRAAKQPVQRWSLSDAGGRRVDEMV